MYRCVAVAWRWCTVVLFYWTIILDYRGTTVLLLLYRAIIPHLNCCTVVLHLNRVTVPYTCDTVAPWYLCTVVLCRGSIAEPHKCILSYSCIVMLRSHKPKHAFVVWNMCRDACLPWFFSAVELYRGNEPLLSCRCAVVCSYLVFDSRNAGRGLV